ncbi:MAG: hypothetical protein R3325_07310 [Thermoanaerobaculia bacterium]|nr:hypothetical protein [Thermoanaerobaculia bacterium]
MDNTGSGISDYDPPTGMMMGATAALNTAGGAALIAMSSVFHVTLGAIFLASGIVLFSWLITRRVPHARVLTLLGFDKRETEEILRKTLGGDDSGGSGKSGASSAY